jgi:hypothetical protein
VDRFRASGPGGQKRNKTDSAVRLRHRPTGLEATAVEERSQHLNRARALRRLRLAPSPSRARPRGPRGLRTGEPLRGRLRASRIEVATRHADYPLVVAEVFDVLEAAGWRLSDAARMLGLSTAALGRFLEGDPGVFAPGGTVAPPEAPAPEPSAGRPVIYYGYYLVGAAFFAQMISAGAQTYVAGVFLVPMTEELDWTRAEFTYAQTVGRFLQAFAGLFLGTLVDRGTRGE